MIWWEDEIEDDGVGEDVFWMYVMCHPYPITNRIYVLGRLQRIDSYLVDNRWMFIGLDGTIINFESPSSAEAKAYVEPWARNKRDKINHRGKKKEE